jgi:hypothetical protein
MSGRIYNRMKDCGQGRHVGWWMEDHALGHEALYVEIKPDGVIISCCEGDRAEKRIYFITGRDKAADIVRAMGKALGMEEFADE